MRLASFVAGNLELMHIEETANTAALWAAYGDDELTALHNRLAAHTNPALFADALGWMAVALTLHELAELFADMQTRMPPELFRDTLELARARLTDHRWAQLARALGMPPVSGVISFRRPVFPTTADRKPHPQLVGAMT